MADSAVILSGVMPKRAQGKKKSSPKNWKDRYFTLSRLELAYFEKADGPKKGSIETNTIAAAEEVKDSFDRTNLFQIVHSLPHITLYIQAPDAATRTAWLSAIRVLIVPAMRMNQFHPGYFNDKSWTCCDKTGAVDGCTQTTIPDE